MQAHFVNPNQQLIGSCSKSVFHGSATGNAAKATARFAALKKDDHDNKYSYDPLEEVEETIEKFGHCKYSRWDARVRGAEKPDTVAAKKSDATRAAPELAHS